MLYADIIVDISHENLDKTYQYAVPEEIIKDIRIGSPVEIPFGMGNRCINGYVVALSQEAAYDIKKIKYIKRIILDGIPIESHLINLAYEIKSNFGSTMNEAIKAVIPIKRTIKIKEKRYIKLMVDNEKALEYIEEFEKKHSTAKARLLKGIVDNDILEYDEAVKKLNISRTVIIKMKELGIINILSERIYRNPVKTPMRSGQTVTLNKEQKEITDDFIREYYQGKRGVYLIHGITGSGKTEVYMEIIDNVIRQGKKVIMLIPEIALTYQTVMRFNNRFGERISIMNSRLSQGERYDQYARAKNGEIDIMIGPRSAIFTPFDNLGLIIIDEEHEGSYKSEMSPKYHAREVAIIRAKMLGASVIMGSATPSLEAYKKAQDGEYKLYKLKDRAGKGKLPEITVVDLREELKKRNKSIFSTHLKKLIEDRLAKHEQVMIFINRRGYAGFVSCRSCGYVMKCPHCDVSLKAHNNTKNGKSGGRLVCHYCGYEETHPDKCPQCGSEYIASFGTGTQKVEEMIKKEFPNSRVLRMDTDTTSTKDGHEKILSSFANYEADILVGTQMIVKGHDFENVTLVGIIAADLSLYANDYKASEKTFQLLLQASGRAGRGKKPGEVVIQTYNPEHYSIVCAAENDYEKFYRQEMSYRTLMKYPPASNILVMLITSAQEEKAETASVLLAGAISDRYDKEFDIIGPSKALVSKINDIYRQVIYVKHENYEMLKELKGYLEGYIKFSDYFKKCNVQFDFNPINTY